MAVVVDTVVLLRLIHDGFAASQEKDDEIYRAAQSLLSVLAFYMRHPLATLAQQHADTIQFLEAEVAKARQRGALNDRESAAW